MNKLEMLEKISKGDLFIQSVSKNQTKDIINILYDKKIFNSKESLEYANSTIYISANRGELIWSDEDKVNFISYEEFINAIYNLSINLPLTIEDFDTEEIRLELKIRDTKRAEDLVNNINEIIEELNYLGYQIIDTTGENIVSADIDYDEKEVQLYEE